MTPDAAPRALPLDRLRDLVAVKENPEFQRLVAEVEGAAAVAALHEQDEGAREDARQRYLAIQDIRNLMDARIGELGEAVRDQPQNAA